MIKSCNYVVNCFRKYGKENNLFDLIRDTFELLGIFVLLYMMRLVICFLLGAIIVMMIFHPQKADMLLDGIIHYDDIKRQQILGEMFKLEQYLKELLISSQMKVFWNAFFITQPHTIDDLDVELIKTSNPITFKVRFKIGVEATIEDIKNGLNHALTKAQNSRTNLIDGYFEVDHVDNDPEYVGLYRAIIILKEKSPSNPPPHKPGNQNQIVPTALCQAVAPSQLSTDKIFIGVKEVEEYGDVYQLYWDPPKHPHMLVCGNTGSGKTYFLKCILVRIVQSIPTARLIICDFKGDEDFSTLDGCSGFYRYDQMEYGLNFMFDLLKNRQNGADKSIPYFLILDEYASYLSHLTSLDKKKKDATINNMARLLMLGRSLNLHVIVSQQRADAKYFDTARDNFQMLIGMGRLSKETVGMLFSDHKEEITGGKDRGKGVCLIGDAFSNFRAPEIENLDSLFKTIRGHVSTQTVPQTDKDISGLRPARPMPGDNAGTGKLTDGQLDGQKEGIP